MDNYSTSIGKNNWHHDVYEEPLNEAETLALKPQQNLKN